MNLLWHNSDQVLSFITLDLVLQELLPFAKILFSRLFYTPVFRRDVLWYGDVRPSQFSALFSYMLWRIFLKFCVSLYFYARKIKFECHQFPSLFAGVMLLFSSPEPKAQVSYCHSAPSVVRRPSVRPSSSVNFHIFNFFSRTAWWILMKLGRDEVLMVPDKCCCFSARSAQGRIQGGAKIGHGGSPSSRIFFFRPEGYSNKPNA